MNIQDNFESILKQHSLSMTRQRQQLFDVLQDKDPLTMSQLTELVDGSIDRASVYRIIASFEETGIVRRINIGWKFKIELSDAFVEHHHHLTCLSCERIIPINQDTLELFISDMAAMHSFTPSQHQIEVQGYCQQCSLRRVTA